MEQPTLPNWVLQNPKKYTKRMTKEMGVIRSSYQHVEFYLENGLLYLEAIICTRSWNQYVIRVYYPDAYPHEPPMAFAMDLDVIQYCIGTNGGRHEFHNYGFDPVRNGLILCVINPNDDGTIGQGWQPEMSAKTILERAILWLHAYEVKKKNPSQKWILPE